MELITLYQLDKASYFTGLTMQVNLMAGFQRGPKGWIEIQPPNIPTGSYAKFMGIEWIITNDPPPPDVPDIIAEPVVPVVNQPSVNNDGPPVVL